MDKQRLQKIGKSLLIVTVVVILFANTVWIFFFDIPPAVFLTGDSMEPTISDGDLVVTVPDEFVNDINEGNIIGFDTVKDGEEVVFIHRVTEDFEENRYIDNENYRTRGDNNPFSDDPIEQKDIVAVVPTVFGQPLVIPHLRDILLVSVILSVTAKIVGQFFNRPAIRHSLYRE